MTALAILITLLIIGAVAKPKTVLRSFAVGFDAMVQGVIWDDELPMTISARCGLLQRRGINWPAKVVNCIMRNKDHCEGAIEADIFRAHALIDLLKAK